jgi:ubiquitin carboxyl-terminal hydrolase 35/38
MIQSLFSCKKFVKSILEINIDGMSEFSFLSQIQNLFGYMYLSQRYAIKASSFIKHCTPAWFKFGQQQDSSEFLIFLLDILAEQLKIFKQNSSSSLSKLIQNSFGIQLTTECECSNCRTKTKRTDMNFYLPLSFNTHQSSTNSEISSSSSSSSSSLSNKKKQSLQNLIDSFFHTELLSSENGNSYSCSQCNSLQSASKRICVTRDDTNHTLPPEYLIFTLNRFIYKVSPSTTSGNSDSTPKNIKIMDQLDYPYEIVINTVYQDKIIPEVYTMIAMVVHSGASLHYGHYYSYITNEGKENFEWLLANDSQISETTFENLIANLGLFKDDTPYVLFYKRVSNTTFAAANKEKQIIQNFDFDFRIENKKLVDAIQQDNQICDLEEKTRLIKRQT